MVLIPEGWFAMGDTLSEGDPDESPLHTNYASAFYVDRYEVSRALWDTVYLWGLDHGYGFGNPGAGKAANHPVESVSWHACVKWCNARSEMEGLMPCYYTDVGLTTIYRTGTPSPYVNWGANGFRLPTETEWEKAARGGAEGRRFPWSSGDTISHSQANYRARTYFSYDQSYPAGFHPAHNDGVFPYTSPTGSFGANGYGVYDMAGNVFEWCWDWWSRYNSDRQTDPKGPASGSARVLRGGSWRNDATRSRSASRDAIGPASVYDDYGFRCVLSLQH
jgi:formylglycine-generating enzyme required for sulfatase activity